MGQSRLFWWASLAGALLLVATRWNVIYAHSVDLGQHYALANELFAQLGDTGVTKEYLGAMIDYPRGAHWAAALLSLVTHSPLVSINILAELATYATYIIIALLLIGEKWQLNIGRLGIMIAAVWWLAAQRAAFGYQVIMNFFFPQLLGGALVFIAVYVLSRDSFWVISRRYQAVILVAMVWLLACVQPLEAMQLGGSVIVLLFLSTLLVERKYTTGWMRLIAWPAVSSSLVLAAVVLHPAFRTMTTIAAHNGYLQFGPWLSPQNYVWLVAFGVISAGLAIRGALNGKFEKRRALILASATLAAAALLVLQKLLFTYFNVGSEYAVSKHVFFLAAISATTFAYVSIVLILPFSTRSATRVGAGRFLGILPPVFSLIALYAVFSTAAIWQQDLRPILEYQAYANNYRKYLLPLDGTGNIVSLNMAFTPTINYLVSLGDLKLPVDIANRSIDSYRIFLDTPVKYAIISTRLADPDALKRCAAGVPASSQYAAVDRACFVESLSVIKADVLLKTGANQRGAAYLTDGWAAPETWGTWSISDTARIEFTIPPQSGPTRYAMHVSYIPFIAGRRQQQTFTVVTDGVAGETYRSTDVTAKEFVAPVDGSGYHVVEVRIQNPVSPRELGLSEDDARNLGIGVIQIELRTRT